LLCPDRSYLVRSVPTGERS